MSTPPRRKHIKILIVEDDEDIRDMIRDLLDIEGYAADTACNGQDALDRLRGSADPELPHLILLDLMMPVKDGFGFRLEQRSDPRLAAIPVVLVTADAHFEEKRKKIGATAALRKPIDVSHLLKVLTQETSGVA